MIFNNCIDTGTFPDIWQWSNIISVHKKGDRQVALERAVPLLSISGRIFGKLYLNLIISVTILNFSKSGFRLNDCCESQLLAIVHDIYLSLDCQWSLEIRGIFLDIFKALDKVCNKGLLYKIQSIRISGAPLKLIESFLNVRYQRVLLNSQATSWSPILAGVLYGSILRPLLFLIYMNHLRHNVSSTGKIFANDTSIFPLFMISIHPQSNLMMT